MKNIPKVTVIGAYFIRTETYYGDKAKQVVWVYSDGGCEIFKRVLSSRDFSDSFVALKTFKGKTLWHQRIAFLSDSLDLIASSNKEILERFLKESPSDNLF